MEPNLGAITYERKAVQTGWIPFKRLILQAEECCVFNGIASPGYRVGDRELGAVMDRGADRSVQRAGSNCFDGL